MFGTLSAEKEQHDAVVALGPLRQRGLPVQLSFFGHASPQELAGVLAEVRVRSLEDHGQHQ